MHTSEKSATLPSKKTNFDRHFLYSFIRRNSDSNIAQQMRTNLSKESTKMSRNYASVSDDSDLKLDDSPPLNRLTRLNSSMPKLPVRRCFNALPKPWQPQINDNKTTSNKLKNSPNLYPKVYRHLCQEHISKNTDVKYFQENGKASLTNNFDVNFKVGKQNDDNYSLNAVDSAKCQNNSVPKKSSIFNEFSSKISHFAPDCKEVGGTFTPIANPSIIQQVVIHKNAEGDQMANLPAKYKYVGDTQGRISPVEPLVTKYSISGSSPHSISKEFASTQKNSVVSGNFSGDSGVLASEHDCFQKENRKQTLLSCFKNREPESRSGFLNYEGFRLPSGGSGHGDRSAPLCSKETHSVLLDCKLKRKSVRKRPNIPNNLCRRRSCEDVQDNNIEIPDSYNTVSAFSLPGSPIIRGNRSSCATVDGSKHGAKSQEQTKFLSSGKITVHSILSTLNFAKYRLEELTVNRGSSKREGNKHTVHTDYSRSTLKKHSKLRNDLEKLKKSTEKLKVTVESKHPMEPTHRFQNLSPASSKPSLEGNKSIINKGRGILKRQSAIVRTYSSPASPHPEGGFHQFQRKSRSASKSKTVTLPTSPIKNASVQTRDIPFRSASVSQVDFNNDYRAENSSPSLRLYPACKDYGRSNTLPRIKLHNVDQNTDSTNKSDDFSQSNLVLESLQPPCPNKGMEGFIADDRLINDKSASWIGGVSSVETSRNAAYLSPSINSLQDDKTPPFHSHIPVENSKSIIKTYLDLPVDIHQQHIVELSAASNTEFTSKQALDAAKKMFLKAKLSDLMAASNNASMEAKSLPTIEEAIPLKNERARVNFPFNEAIMQPIDPNQGNVGDAFKDLKPDSVLNEYDEYTMREGEILTQPQYPKLDQTIECHVLETERKRSQCLVIRSSSFGRQENNMTGSPLEASATSECRVVQTRPRLSIGDSESESAERGAIGKLHAQASDDVASTDENSYKIPEYSDSSSQESFSNNSDRQRLRQCSSEPDLDLSKYISSYAAKHLMGLEADNIERSFTYPPLRKVRFQSINKQRSKLLQCEIHKNLTSKTSDLYDLSNIASQIESLLFDNDRKYYQQKGDTNYAIGDSSRLQRIRRNSDPGERRDVNQERISYFSDSNIESGSKASKCKYKKAKVSRHQSTKVIISQDSTDSEGRDQHLNLNIQRKAHLPNSQGMFSPQVILSDHENEISYPDCTNYSDAYNNRYEYSRNASPTPYFGDSDTGERSAPRSPQIPRRYSKRPLRGPYGEMLEAEMSKSKSNSLLLADDTYLQPRDSNSVSPRPCSPSSPIHLSPKSIVHRGTSPMFIMGGSPLQDLRPVSAGSYFSVDSHIFDNQDEDGNKVSYIHPKATSNSESDNEHNFNVIGPSHHRTISSPSKLFFQEDDNEILSYFPKARPSTVKQANEDKLLLPKPKRTVKTSEPQKSISSANNEALKKDSKDDRSHVDQRTHWRQRDTRAHIIGELHDTERNYVGNLNFLLSKYHSVLKKSENQNLIEPNQVDVIFFQIPEIHSYHAKILEELRRRIDTKDQALCVGDIFLQKIRDPKLVESYKSFVSNWKIAQETTKMVANSKPAFKQFLSSMTKEHRGKRDLKGLLITPVQRFPHYELILKRLLQHTNREHPDYPLTKEAITEVQKVGAIVNAVGQESFRQEEQQVILREIENFIEGLDCLVHADRSFIQLDQVTQLSGLSLRKERCLFLFSDILILTAIKRRSATIRKSSSLQVPLLSSLESNKLKLLKFIPLDDLEIGRSRDDSNKKLFRELEALDEDLRTLQQVSSLIQTLHFPKGALEEVLHDLNSNLKMRKQLIDRQSSDSFLCELELNITQEGLETFSLMFSTPEKRNAWEESFTSAKQKLAMSADRKPLPEFVDALPIQKTRAGLQFTCAAPTLSSDPVTHKDVWVCNSDGHVGQVCVLSLQAEPTVVCCNGVCNSKILSIASIPATTDEELSDDDDDEDIPVTDDGPRCRQSESPSSQMNCDQESDPLNHTVWLGTEDGSIHVYNCSDTIRTKKKRFNFQPGSSVHYIIHVENRVFASLASGDVMVYERDSQGYWTEEGGKRLTLSSAAAPIIRMVLAAGKLWCSTDNSIIVLNVETLEVESSFEVKSESGTGKSITCMVAAGQSVWVAVQNSATVKLYHAANYEWICDVPIKPAVTKMLAGCDDIIRQHKVACLKITALLICKDLLWVGTTAGVIVVLPIPHLSTSPRRLPNSLNAEGIQFGHTGYVRFLTCVEIGSEGRPARMANKHRYSFLGKEHSLQAGVVAPSKFLVISGGDGFEDFRSPSSSEMAGKNDTTNHLLLWQV